MKTSAAFRFLGLPVLLALPALAQVGAANLGAHNGALGGSAALGAMTHPLGGFSNGFVPGYSNGRFGIGSRGYNNFGSRGNRRGPVGYPYAYSIWVPDYFDYVDQASQYYAAPYPGAPIPPQGAPAPSQPVIINQYFSAPPPGSVQPAPPPETGATASNAPSPNTAAPGAPIGDPQNYYLIAFKDHAVFPALSYWVEDKTLHYVTMQNTHNQASINLIDEDLTKKLNQDRNVAFSLNGQ